MGQLHTARHVPTQQEFCSAIDGEVQYSIASKFQSKLPHFSKTLPDCQLYIVGNIAAAKHLKDVFMTK